jgi:hypothetical protein
MWAMKAASLAKLAGNGRSLRMIRPFRASSGFLPAATAGATAMDVSAMLAVSRRAAKKTPRSMRTSA